MTQFTNLTAITDLEFYQSNAASCARRAQYFVIAGDIYLSGWYARRAAS